MDVLRRTARQDGRKGIAREDYARAEADLRKAVAEGKISGEDARAAPSGPPMLHPSATASEINSGVFLERGSKMVVSRTSSQVNARGSQAWFCCSPLWYFPLAWFMRNLARRRPTPISSKSGRSYRQKWRRAKFPPKTPVVTDRRMIQLAISLNEEGRYNKTCSVLSSEEDS